jgi:RecB family exonuclease
MTNPDEARRVEIKDGEQTVAAADVSQQPDGATRASLHPVSGHVAPGHRAELVDAIVDLPEVREGDRLEATVPLGDGEALDRLRERTEQTETRPAGSTALFDGTIPDGATESGDGPPDSGPPGP